MQNFVEGFENQFELSGVNDVTTEVNGLHTYSTSNSTRLIIACCVIQCHHVCYCR